MCSNIALPGLNVMGNALTALMLFMVITSLLAIATRGRDIRVFGKRITFTIGGVLVFLGSERKAKKIGGIERRLAYLAISVLGLGMILFYTSFLPMIVDFIRKFILFSIGAINVRPQPPIIPVPLLLQYTDVLIYIAVSIGIGVAAHEIMHAIIALKEGIHVKSWGFGILFLFPIAFVELDEESYRRASPLTKLTVLCAGVLANAIIALGAILGLLATSYYMHALSVEPAVVIDDIDCGICKQALYADRNATLINAMTMRSIDTCPAKLAGISPGSIVVLVNGSAIHTINDLANIIRNSNLNSTLILRLCTSEGACRDVAIRFIYHIQLDERLGRVAFYRVHNGNITPCIGVKLVQSKAVFNNGVAYIPPQLWILETLQYYLSFLFMVNFSLYVLNSIPLLITDGSRVLEVLSERSKLLSKMIKYRIVDLVNIVIIGTAIIIATYVLLSR